MISYPTILNIIEEFYQKATFDFMIGYHFRKIADFETHIPRIAVFWELQLTGKTEKRHELPFNLIAVHKPLGIKKGELGRWVVLFKETLQENVKHGKVSAEQASVWIEKVNFFEKKLFEKLF